MAIERSKRSRRRKADRYSAAQLVWLTGVPDPEANAFALLAFELPAEPRDFDAMAAVLDRAEGVVSAERIAELRAYVADLRARDRRNYPKRPEYVGERIHG